VDGLSMRWKIAGILFGSLILWELMARFFVLSPAQEVFEPRLGYIHAPHAQILRTYEGYARFSLDQFGLNNDDLPVSLPENRVFVVGDSFVESYQVMRDENFVSRLGEEWRDSLLFNAGSSGAAPDKSLTAYELLQATVQPTHILLCVNASDLYELSSAKVERNIDGSVKNLWREQDEPTAFTPVKLWIYGHSGLITHVKWKYENDIRAWLAGKNEKIESRKSHKLSGKHLQQAVEYWTFVLQSFQQEGVKLTVLMMPEVEYLAHQVAKPKARQGRVVLSNEAMKLGVPVLDSNALFVQDFQQTGIPAIGFANTHYGKGHINAHGHQILANWLAGQRDVILR